MKIFHLTGNIDPDAGGPAYSIPKLCETLRDCGNDVELLTLRGLSEVGIATDYKSFPTSYFPDKVGHSPEMWSWIRNSFNYTKPDILHSHNLWRMPSIYPAIATARWGVPHIVSPRGTLTSYSMGTGSSFKRICWPLVQQPVLKLASGFHATADSELHDIRRLGFTQPIAVIPNGIELPLKNVLNLEFTRPRTVLYFGRLHPEKGLADLLRAWGQVSPYHKDWELLIAGPDTIGYRCELERIVEHEDISGVTFEGPQYGHDKYDVYRRAALYVLPSPSENFGIAVAEALSMSLPVIANKGAPWEGLNSHRCGWWVENGISPLAEALNLAMRTHPHELFAMGMRGRNWMGDAFSWPDIGKKMQSFYQFILGREAQPDFVYMS